MRKDRIPLAGSAGRGLGSKDGSVETGFGDGSTGLVFDGARSSDVFGSCEGGAGCELLPESIVGLGPGLAGKLPGVGSGDECCDCGATVGFAGLDPELAEGNAADSCCVRIIGRSGSAPMSNEQLDHHGSILTNWLG